MARIGLGLLRELSVAELSTSAPSGASEPCSTCCEEYLVGPGNEQREQEQNDDNRQDPPNLKAPAWHLDPHAEGAKEVFVSVSATKPKRPELALIHSSE